MRADHHHFVAQPRIRARNLGDDVVAERILGEVAALDVDAHLDRHVIFEKSNEIVVMLTGDDDRRHRVRSGVARLQEDRPVLAATRLEHRANADVVQQLGDALRFARAPPRPPPAPGAPPRPPRCPAGAGATAGGAFGAVGLIRSSRMNVVINGCVSTIAPLSRSRILSSESYDNPAIYSGVPTISPFVDSDHASG